MTDDLAEWFGPLGIGVGAGMTAAALIYATTGMPWIGCAIAAAIALLIGLASLAWSTR